MAVRLVLPLALLLVEGLAQVIDPVTQSRGR
jgi:hypothetical protein